VQLGAFVTVLIVPAAQAVQIWLVLGVPAVETYCPGLQVVKAVHAATAFVVAGVPAATLKVPVGQAKQVGGDEALATGFEYCPAMQLGPYGRHAATLAALIVVLL
jgi:hypothetical protein